MDKKSLPNEDYQYGFSKPDRSLVDIRYGINKDIIKYISGQKDEEDWILKSRLAAYEFFKKSPMPSWGADLSEIDFNNICFYARSNNDVSNNWDTLPQEIKDTYDKIGIPEAEKKFLSGASAQYDSEIVYHNIKKELEEKGIIFCSPEEAAKTHKRLFRKYFGTVIPFSDNKFSALNSAVFSGGTFIYVPPYVKVEVPLQAYFRINLPSFGQFERTLIIADKYSEIHYIEGCTAPIYSKDSLHSAVVEIVALEGSCVRYSTVQNWSKNVYNLVTKRAVAYKNAKVYWIDGNLGSKATMKYPAIQLKGENSYGEVLSLAFASSGKNQDSGGKVVHLANNTKSIINSKSISKNGGVSSYRGLVVVKNGLKNIKTKVQCDAMILDDISTSNTYPYMDINSDDVQIEHEASISKISQDQLNYLLSRGFSELEAKKLIVSGFLDPLVKELPMEYAVELNKLIDLEIEGSLG